MPLIRNLISAFVPERQPELSVDPETGLITSSGKKPSAFRRWLDPESGARYENTKKAIALENASLMGQNARTRQEHANKLELEKINTQNQKDIIAYQNGLISERELKLKQIEQANRLAELEAQSAKQKDYASHTSDLGVASKHGFYSTQLPTLREAAQTPEALGAVRSSVVPQQSADIRSELARTVAAQAASESDKEQAGTTRRLFGEQNHLLDTSSKLLQDAAGASLLDPIANLKAKLLQNIRAANTPVSTTKSQYGGGEISIMPNGTAISVNPAAIGKAASITPVVREQMASELPPRRAVPQQSTDLDPLAAYRAELEQQVNDNLPNSPQRMRKLNLNYTTSPFLTNAPSL